MIDNFKFSLSWNSEILWDISSTFTEKQPSETEVNQLVDDAEKYTLANHIFWGLWGLISVSISASHFFISPFIYIRMFKSLTSADLQAYVNKIDFNYKEYARQRFQQYWMKKQELLSSSTIRQKINVNGHVSISQKILSDSCWICVKWKGKCIYQSFSTPTLELWT